MHGRATLLPPGGSVGLTADVAGRAAIKALCAVVNDRLGVIAASTENAPKSLNGAIRHALLAPGKRIRPLLVLLTTAQFGHDPMRALDAACAVELVHTASLVLDDLPCMDDANTRRGIASTHIAFSEATAMLAAIAMLTRAFNVLARMEGLPVAARNDLTAILSYAAGSDGLTSGQERDLTERCPTDALDKINVINDQKTGALFVAALQMGGRVAAVDDACLAALAVAGREIGLAFQAYDDVIDMSRSPAEAGKDTGKDQGKATVATVLGLDEARAQVALHIGQAHLALEPYAAGNGPLRMFISAMFEPAMPATAVPPPAA